eukprot:g4945.t1
MAGGHGAGYCNGDCVWHQEADRCQPDRSRVAPSVRDLIRRYSFQPVRTQAGKLTDIVLVRAPFRGDDEALFRKWNSTLLFLGISSFEDYPLPSGNPFSEPFAPDRYAGLFPGWLHMFRPERARRVFPPHVKLLLMSQSNFALPAYPPRTDQDRLAAEFDFTYSGSDQDVASDCVGWSSFAKNWTLVKQALAVMCGEYRLRGVLVATKDKTGTRACTIPDSCRGLMLQTTYLDQRQYLDYVRRSRFQFLPQVHDASPRTAAQALALDVPVLMNAHISGGWKYVTEAHGETGEFFHGMGDLRAVLDRLLAKAKQAGPGAYAPQRWMRAHYGDELAGPRLLRFVQQHFADRVKLPPGTTGLFPSGA